MSTALGDRPWQDAGVTERYSFTCGRGKSQSVWDSRKSFSWDELARLLTNHKVGPKDGYCLVPATFRGTSRKMDEADQIDVAMLDADAGHTLEEIAEAVERHGWRAIISSTHSHLTTQTEVSASAYDKWTEKNPGQGLADFLAAVKHLLPRVVQDACLVKRFTKRERGKDVEYCIFEHHPCPKYRVTIPLAVPWRASDYKDQNAANDAWRAAVAALAHALGLQHDQSCTDTSRLFYLPRHPQGTPPESRVIDGEVCDIWELPEPPESNGHANGKAKSSLGLDFGASGPRVEYVDPSTGETIDLTSWSGHHADRFEIVKALQARSPGVFGTRRSGVKHHLTCPFEVEHTTPGQDGTYVVNASEIGQARLSRRKSGFYIGCNHNACQGRDRLDFLTGMLDHGWLHIDDLTDERFLIPAPNGAGHGGSFAENNGDYDDEFGPGQQQQQQQQQQQAPQTAPLDIFGDTALSGCPDLPLGILPKVVEEFALDQSELLGVDVGFVALPCLVALATAARDRWRIQPMRHNFGWQESARIWAAMVAPVGTLKTPVLRTAMAPIKTVEKEWFREWIEAQESYETELKLYERQQEKYIKSRAEGNTVEQPTKPPAPPRRRLVAEDVTTESLSDILSSNEDGILVLRDELTGWFASFDAYRDKGASGKDRADWLELYEGGVRHIDRVKRGRIQVPNWSACLLGGIQPDMMRRIAARSHLHEDGLLQRFMVIHGRKVGPGVDREPNVEASRLYAKKIRDLIACSPQDGTASAVGDPVVTLSDEAHVWREELFKVVDSLLILPSTPPAFGGHLNKWKGLFSRLLLLFHLIETAGTERRPDSEPVPGETAERVARFMLDYLLPHAARFYGETIGHGEGYEHVRRVAMAIISGDEKPTEISARWVYRACRELRGDLEGVETVLQVLEVAGWIDPILANPQSRGRPTKQWMVNPEVHRLFAPRAEEYRRREQARREAVQEALRTLGDVLGQQP